MKRVVIFAVICFSALSCSKENLKEHFFADNLPGRNIGEIAIDSKGAVWIESSEIDSTVKLPDYSSSIPTRIFLTRFTDDTYEVCDDRFMGAKAMITDKYDRLWFIHGNKLLLLENDKYTELFTGSDDNGYFEWITIDTKSNLWTGGWNVPLLKITIDPEIKVENITVTSASANSSAGCFDSSNNLWIIMPGNSIGKMDDQGIWTFYNHENSSIPDQAFWCITAGRDNNIWAGTGIPGGISLIRFDGSKWESVVPKDDSGNPVNGTVRMLYSDNKKIWLVSEFTKNGVFDSNYLITYDGTFWRRNNTVPFNDVISDVAFDLTRKTAWIGTWNDGCFIVDQE
jgi:hypothetical protein